MSTQFVLDCFPPVISQFGLLGVMWSVFVALGLLYVAYDMAVDIACAPRLSTRMKNTIRRANYRR